MLSYLLWLNPGRIYQSVQNFTCPGPIKAPHHPRCSMYRWLSFIVFIKDLAREDVQRVQPLLKRNSDKSFSFFLDLLKLHVSHLFDDRAENKTSNTLTLETLFWFAFKEISLKYSPFEDKRVFIIQSSWRKSSDASSCWQSTYHGPPCGDTWTPRARQSSVTGSWYTGGLLCVWSPHCPLILS